MENELIPVILFRFTIKLTMKTLNSKIAKTKAWSNNCSGS